MQGIQIVCFIKMVIKVAMNFFSLHKRVGFKSQGSKIAKFLEFDQSVDHPKIGNEKSGNILKYRYFPQNKICCCGIPMYWGNIDIFNHAYYIINYYTLHDVDDCKIVSICKICV